MPAPQPGLPLPTAEPQALGFAPEHLSRITRALNAEIAAGALPGAVLMIARRGRLGFCETFGHLDPAARTPMPADAMFSIASMANPLVTAGGLVLCEERGVAVNQTPAP